jgi:hypothetical protein
LRSRTGPVIRKRQDVVDHDRKSWFKGPVP